jgi:transketolase C-terminal domain/subunit
MSVAPGLQPESWHLLTLLDRAPGLQALGDTLADLVDEGHPVVAGTADLKYSNGLVRFQDRHPEHRVSTPLHRHGLHDEYSLIGPPTHLYRHYELDADGIATVARRQLESGPGVC